jgi:hypothetical protein
MCKAVTLHHNEHGYVSWCGHCSHMSLAFGNMMVAFGVPQAESFVKVLSLDAGQYAGRICVKEKAFVYNSDSRHVKFVLNYTEVEQLLELLNKALLMHEVKQLLGEKQGEA